ncbi:MAG: sulfite exporter TauE/SafE family protein [Pleomorphochaeta sp.]
MYQYILLGIVVLITHFLEGITGFGCTVLALPFAILLVGIHAAVPVLVMLSFLLCLYIVIISKKDIVWKEYLKIVIFVGLGLPIGILSNKYLDENILTLILSIFMVLVGTRGLWQVFGKRNNDKQLPKFLTPIILLLGGTFQGAFGSGGPLVVTYAAKALPQKNQFRATLCMLWVTLNAIMITQNIATGMVTPDMWHLLLILIPFLVVGALLGNWAHHHIKDSHFSTIVYGVLVASGIVMMCS